MKKEDQRIKVTKILIKDALSQLLKEKPFEKISIKELCDLADINRGTFYSHYKDLSDLQDKIYKEFFDNFKLSFVPMLEKASEDTLTSENMILEIIKFLHNNKSLCQIMLHGANKDNFLNSLNAIGRNIVIITYSKFFFESKKDIELFYNFVSGGAISIIITWLLEDCKTKDTELAYKLNRLIKCSLSYFE